MNSVKTVFVKTIKKNVVQSETEPLLQILVTQCGLNLNFDNRDFFVDLCQLATGAKKISCANILNFSKQSLLIFFPVYFMCFSLFFLCFFIEKSVNIEKTLNKTLFMQQ